MGFVGIVRSFEELLYELVTWLIFYPRTLWRIIVNPTRMTLYSDDEQDDPESNRYSDALSPPVLLMLTLIICYSVETSAGLTTQASDNPVTKVILGSPQNLLILRGVVFATIPLFISTRLLARKGRVIDRATLRPPFYAQCYLAAPLVLALSLAGIAHRAVGVSVLAQLLLVSGIGWFVWAERQWLGRQEQLSGATASLAAVVFVGFALLVGMGVAALLAATLL